MRDDFGETVADASLEINTADMARLNSEKGYNDIWKEEVAGKTRGRNYCLRDRGRAGLGISQWRPF